jgi:hypothetical protein
MRTRAHQRTIEKEDKKYENKNKNLVVIFSFHDDHTHE